MAGYITEMFYLQCCYIKDLRLQGKDKDLDMLQHQINCHIIIIIIIKDNDL